MQDAEAYYKQEQNIKYVSDSYGKESWVRVSGKDILNRAEAHFWCALIKKTKVKSVFRDFHGHRWLCQMDRDLRVAEVLIHIKGISLPAE